MADRVYTKTVLPDKLQDEVEAQIAGILERILVINGSECRLTLSREPTAAEDSLLTQIVNDHVPSYPLYKIWEFIQEHGVEYEPPLDVDYVKGLTIRLHPKSYFDKGELVKREYYENASVNPDGSINFTNLIVQEENSFLRDIGGFVISRQKTISWVRDDETLGPITKINTKYYDGVDKIQEGYRRRGNLIDALMMNATNSLLYNKAVARIIETGDPNYTLTAAEVDGEIQRGRLFLTEYEDLFSGFKTHSDRAILTAIQNDTNHDFLDEFIPNTDPAVDFRTYIISEMTI